MIFYSAVAYFYRDFVFFDSAPPPPSIITDCYRDKTKHRIIGKVVLFILIFESLSVVEMIHISSSV